MGRAVLILANAAIRAKAVTWIMKARDLSRIEFKGPARTLDQNAKLWAMLTDVAQQKEWAGKRRTTEEWKDLFTASLASAEGGLEVVPGLTGGFMLFGLHTSDMSVEEMTKLIEWIYAWGADQGVTWSEPEPDQATAA